MGRARAMAWVVSGRLAAETLAYVESVSEAQRHTADILKTLQEEQVLMLLSDRMDESLVLLSHFMGWDLGKLRFRDMTERVQKQKKYQCREGPCRDAILSCNLVDDLLYKHYAAGFDTQMQEVTDKANRVELFKRKWQSRDDGAWSRKYPTNCKQGPDKDTFTRLHKCGSKAG